MPDDALEKLAYIIAHIQRERGWWDRNGLQSYGNDYSQGVYYALKTIENFINVLAQQEKRKDAGTTAT